MGIVASRRIGDLLRELLPLPCPVKCAFHYFIRATPPVRRSLGEVGCYSLPPSSSFAEATADYGGQGYSPCPDPIGIGVLFPTILQIGIWSILGLDKAISRAKLGQN